MRVSTPRTGRSSSAAAVLTALALLACNDSTGAGSGSFSAEVTGATNASYSGSALALPLTAGYGILLETGATEGPDHAEILLAREAFGAPDPGTYDIVDILSVTDPRPEEFGVTLSLSYGEPDERSCHAVGGTITFTSTSSRRAEGTFEFTMLCTRTEDEEAPEEEASVTGTFEAVAVVQL